MIRQRFSPRARGLGVATVGLSLLVTGAAFAQPHQARPERPFRSPHQAYAPPPAPVRPMPATSAAPSASHVSPHAAPAVPSFTAPSAPARAPAASHLEDEAFAKAVEENKATAARGKVDLSVFGMMLGDSLNLPVCPSRGSSPGLGALLGVGHGGAQTCVGDPTATMMLGLTAALLGSTGLQRGPATGQVVAVGLADTACPNWVKTGGACTVFVTTKNGVAVAARVQTGSMEIAGEIDRALQSKYVTPVSKPTVGTCSNEYGATTQADERVWSPPGLHVTYEPLGPDCIHGQVIVELESFRRSAAETKKAQEDTQPKM